MTGRKAEAGEAGGEAGTKRYFDTHTHYNHTAFSHDLPEVMRKIQDAGVERDAVIGYDLPTSRAALMMARQDPRHIAVAGLHPLHIGESARTDFAELCDLFSGKAEDTSGAGTGGKGRPLAVGEIGLDYSRRRSADDPVAEVQQEYFRKQLRLAGELCLPVVIHSRDAAEDTYRILKEENAGKYGGVIHCYSYSPEMAERFVGLGFYLGIGGVITRQGARRLTETVKRISMEHLVLETDCPYLPPESMRGQRNDSSVLPMIADRIARIKDISLEEVGQAAWENACRLYGL